MTLDEFGQAIKSHQQKNAPRPGEKSTLEQRQAQKGLSILDLSESVFHEMDTDGDGDVTFKELLKLMFRCARACGTRTLHACADGRCVCRGAWPAWRACSAGAFGRPFWCVPTRRGTYACRAAAVVTWECAGLRGPTSWRR